METKVLKNAMSFVTAILIAMTLIACVSTRKAEVAVKRDILYKGIAGDVIYEAKKYEANAYFHGNHMRLDYTNDESQSLGGTIEFIDIDLGTGGKGTLVFSLDMQCSDEHCLISASYKDAYVYKNGYRINVPKSLIPSKLINALLDPVLDVLGKPITPEEPAAETGCVTEQPVTTEKEDQYIMATKQEKEVATYGIKDKVFEVKTCDSTFTSVETKTRMSISDFSIENGLEGTKEGVAAFYPFEDIFFHFTASYNGIAGQVSVCIVPASYGLQLSYEDEIASIDISGDITKEPQEVNLRFSLGEEGWKSQKLGKSVTWAPGFYLGVFSCDNKILGYTTLELLEDDSNAISVQL